MNDPKVSIGLPVYNGANYIVPAVKSILSQDFQDLELIISDNCSTDNTASICNELLATDSRIRYHRNTSNIGAAKNYNNVFELAKGKYFKWAAHDDECHQSMIRRCVEVLDCAPAEVTMVYPLGELIDEEGKTLLAPLDRIECKDPRPYRRLAYLLRSLNMCDPIFGVYRSEYLRKTQLIGPFCGPDYVLLGELCMMGEIWEIDEVLFRLRAHSGRSMKANKDIRARTAWHDPEAAKRLILLPVWEQMVWALLQSTLRSELSAVERVKCALTVPSVHYYRRFKNFGGRLRQRVLRRPARKQTQRPVKVVSH